MNAPFPPLARYNAAKRALAEAKAVDEVKEIRNAAAAMAAYARQAKDREMEADAAEIRMRAERKIGELMAAQKAAGLMAPAGKHRVIGSKTDPIKKPTLAEAGIDKNLADRARKLAAVPELQFESIVSEARTQVTNFSANISAKMLRDKDKAERRAAHRARTLADGCTVDDLQSLAASGYRAGVIYADPPWRFGTRTAAGKDRSPEQHYNTESLSKICRLPVPALAADDCALFMWAAKPILSDAFAVMTAWGFEFKTVAFTWVKQNPSAQGYFMGLGFWTRSNPEICLLGTKGNPTRIAEDVRELVVAPVDRHSEKPEEVRRRIERLVAGPYLELYGRKPAANWRVWGNEISAKDFGS